MMRFLIFCLLFTASLNAGYTFKDGQVYDSKYVPSASADEHFQAALEAFKAEDWGVARQQFLTITKSFRDSSRAKEALFYTGACFYQLGDLDKANAYLSDYLSSLDSATHYEDAFAYKFAIAEQYRSGSKKHLFDVKILPKLSSGHETAIEIYDEIIFSLPATDLAAKSYFAKAGILQLKKEYVESVDTYQQLIGKFPSHKYSAQAFGEISRIYLSKLKRSTLDPDLIELARMNYRKALAHFPKSPVIDQVQANVVKMEEEYALNLYETGRLYERKKEPKASVVYYYNVLRNFPQTDAAKDSKNRLKKLNKYAVELGIEADA